MALQLLEEYFVPFFVKEGGGEMRHQYSELMFNIVNYGYGFFAETFHSKKEPLNEVSAPLGHAYLCKAKLKAIKLTAVNSSVDVSLMDVKFQPFEVENGKFSKNGKGRMLTRQTTIRCCA